MLLHDLRVAWRRARRQPGLTLTIVLTLAVGIGATTATFGILDAALLRPLPFAEPGRLVVGSKSYDGGRSSRGPVSGHDFFDVREASRSFESLAAATWAPTRFTVTGDDREPERVAALFVTWDLFATLGVPPALGRSFGPEEAVVDGAPVVMVSHGYWQRRFGGSPAAVGSELTVNGRPAAVVGVMPAGFRFLYDVDVWALTYRDGPSANARRWHNLLAVGRLTPGVSLTQAQDEVGAIAASLARQYPESNQGKTMMLQPLRSFVAGGVQPSLLLLMATVVLVLLVACANVAGLLLARGVGRGGEVAVRAAIGASRAQLVRQHLVESVMQGAAAGLLGIGVALACQRLLLRLLPLGRAGAEVRLDAGVLLFALLLSLLTALLFGALPALRSVPADLAGRLRAGRRGTEDRRGARLRAALITAQVAMAAFLLVGSTLLARSLTRQLAVDLGFRADRLLTAGVVLPADRYATEAAQEAFFAELHEGVLALPGVEAVGFANQLPVRSPMNDIYAWPATAPPTSAEDSRSAYDRIVRPGYFAAMGIPLLLGRGVTDDDRPGTRRVVVLGAAMAREFFPAGSPIGERVVIDLGDPVEHEVIGVAGDVVMANVRAGVYRTMYTAHAQRGSRRMELAVRTAGPPELAVGPLKALLQRLDRDVPLAEPAAMTALMDDTMAGPRVVTMALVLFAGVAALLTAVGLYSLLAFWVGQRLGELGVRMALGAGPAVLVRLVAGRGLVLVGAGLVLGLAGAAAGSRLLGQLLFQVRPLDPASYAAAAALLLAVTTAACLVPALRASRLDPVAALRAE